MKINRNFIKNLKIHLKLEKKYQFWGVFYFFLIQSRALFVEECCLNKNFRKIFYLLLSLTQRIFTLTQKKLKLAKIEKNIENTCFFKFWIILITLTQF